MGILSRFSIGLLLFLFSLYSVLSLTSGQEQDYTSSQYKDDFNFFWTSINDDYCYFNKKKTDWLKVKEIYSREIDSIKTKDQFVSVLEKVFYEIYDHHASLNMNTDYSQRLVPSKTDIWAEFVNDQPIITQVRKNYGAERCGIAAGMKVIAIDDLPFQKAIEPFIGKSLIEIDNEARSYALRLALAGNHIKPRKLTLQKNDIVKDYFPDAEGLLLERIKYSSRIESRIIEGIGYIKINDCLFENELIREFDSVMQTMQNTSSLILDLRETPSGGNTTVARAILGWFINKEEYYQKHELFAEEKAFGIKRSWGEIVSPREGKYYSKPVVVLADHWTGSIAEGITIAFDGMKRAKVIGTTLARLNGATYSYQMPNTKINFSFPVERLYHINGVPRELYEPTFKIDYTEFPPPVKKDPVLEKALSELK